MGGNHAEAEDALGQVMLKAQQQMVVSASQIATPRAWLTRLAHNLCIDIQRDLARRTSASRQLEIWAEAGGELGSKREEDSDLPLLTAESEAENRRRVDRLPPELRESFVLRFYHELSCEEIATQLGLSAANVRKRLQLARAFLRQHWHFPPSEESAPPPGTQRTTLCQGQWELTAPAG
jgi:RNA polymerase sigma-70 factor (ECF subfamily)